MPDTYSIPSNSRPGVKYIVRHEAGGWTCDCVAGQMGKECAHIKKVKNIFEGTGRKVNEYVARISGKVNMEEGLELGDDVAFIVRGSVVKLEFEDKQDGTYDAIAKVKPISIEKYEESRDN